MLKNLVLPEKEKSGKKQNKKKLSIPHRLWSFVLSLALNRFPLSFLHQMRHLRRSADDMKLIPSD